jgi:hypothetical protein
MTENLGKELCETLTVTFAETVYLDSNSTSTEELWNWAKMVGQQCPHNSSDGLCAHREQLLESCKIQIQPTDEIKLKWILEYHDPPVTGHPERAKTYNLLSQSHSWNEMRKDMDCYVQTATAANGARQPREKPTVCYDCQMYWSNHRRT